MVDVIIDTLIDGAKLLPFLFLTYLLLEFIEHKAKEKTEMIMMKSGVLGPAVGGLLGIVPQCGFSASASNLYAENIISAGTLIAVFLSTSDEMLPIMIAEAASARLILTILLAKVVIGILVGFTVDAVTRFLGRTKKEIDIESFCRDENCGCEEGGIFRSAIIHTAKIALFVIAVSFALNIVIYFIGEETLGSVISGLPVVIGPLVTAIFGLVPNCAASVVITKLYLGGVISSGSMLAGLLAGSGVGMLVLFKVSKKKRANLSILAVTLLSGAAVGIITDVLGIVF